MKLKQAIQMVNVRLKAVAKERDRLDDAIADLEQLRDDCSEAYEALQDARDALSRLV